MSVLDKQMFLTELMEKLNNYVPTNTVSQIINDAGESLTRYEITSVSAECEDGIEENKQLIQMFISAKKMEGKSKNTLDRYAYAMKHLNEAICVPFRQMTVYHIRQYMMNEQQRGISMNSIRGNCWVYGTCFRWLFDEGLIPKNPTANIGTIKAKKKEEPPFTYEQIQLLKENANGAMETALIHFLLSTGCRISETCNVNRDSLDFDNMSLHIVGKGDKPRTVYFDNITAMMLKRYLKTRKDDNPALFYSKRSKQGYTDGGIRLVLKKIGRRANVEGVHPHRFRHTLATNLVDRGMNVQDVSYLLGHEKMDTTMIYVHKNDKNTENAYRKYINA